MTLSLLRSGRPDKGSLHPVVWGRRFLETVHGGAKDKGLWLNIYTLPDKHSEFFEVTEPGLNAAAEYAYHRRQTHNVYFALGLFREKPASGRGLEKDVAAIPGFWLDLDFAGPDKKKQYPPTEADALALLAEFPHVPSVIVRSGGGLHVYWLFDTPWIFATEEERLRAWCLSKGTQKHLQQLAEARGWKIDSTADLTRVLRVPGTLYHKQKPPKLVEVLL